MGLASRSWLTLLASGWLASAALQAANAPTTVRLTGGTRFPLELAHHLTSGYTPAGSPVYFRVLSDVRVGDQVLIRGGTVVEGRMQATGDRKMNATSGTMNFSVRHVPAVDGQNVRVIATVSQEGRDRDGALLGWVFMWGAFGLMTKGVDAYAMRGARLDAEVLSDRLIVPTAAPVPAVAPASRMLTASGHRQGKARDKELRVSLERARTLEPLEFLVAETAGLGAATLVSVNDEPVPETIRSLTNSDTALGFTAWDIVKYCNNGPNKIRLRANLANGDSLDIVHDLPVRLERKVPK